MMIQVEIKFCPEMGVYSVQAPRLSLHLTPEKMDQLVRLVGPLMGGIRDMADAHPNFWVEGEVPR